MFLAGVHIIHKLGLAGRRVNVPGPAVIFNSDKGFAFDNCNSSSLVIFFLVLGVVLIQQSTWLGQRNYGESREGVWG